MPAIIATDDLLYANPLARESDLTGWIREGVPVCSFPQGRLRLENGLDPALGQQANFLLWCPERLPADLVVRWSFQPLREPGLAMVFIRANGRDGRDLFDPALERRDGQYHQYHSGDIDAYHASYFRRKNPDGERDFHTCNLRKSRGFHLVCQGADPLPDVADARRPYRIELAACGPHLHMRIDDLLIWRWTDDASLGPVLGAGYLGLRQMAPLIAEYHDLTVHRAVLA